MKFVVPIPQNFRILNILGFASVLFLLQLISGSDYYYSFLIFLFIVVTGLTINVLGGLSTLSGFCVAMMTCKILIISQIAKILFWQAGDSYLKVPLVTAGVMLVGIIGIYAAALVSQFVKFKSFLLAPIVDPRELHVIWGASYFIGIFCFLYSSVYALNAATDQIDVGGSVGFLKQIAFIYPLSIVTATASTLLLSGGQRSFGSLVGLSVLTEFAFGLITTNKAMMFEPFFYYIATCIAFGFSFRLKNIIIIGVFTIFSITVLAPFTQAARGLARMGTFVDNISTIINSLDEIDIGRLKEDVEAYNETKSDFQYYNNSMGLLDRFSLILQVDRLILSTITNGPLEWTTIVHGFKMLPPRFLYSEKPVYNSANILGHRISAIGAEDDSTQISFGLIAEAYISFEWIGVILIPFVLTLIFFTVYKKITGGVRRNIWSIFLFGYFQHIFVETTIASMMIFLVHFPLLLSGYYFLFKGLLFLVRARSWRI